MGALVCLLACNSSPADVDAGADGSVPDASFTDVHDASKVDPDACATCASLTAFCVPDASDLVAAHPCPPDLDSPDFDAWARDRFSKQIGPFVPSCGATSACLEKIVITFNNGVDCALQYVFDATTKKLVAIDSVCNGHAQCVASDGCLPVRCINEAGAPLAASSGCPPMPDAGPLDAASD